jgi:hypothetical protein
MARFVRHPSGKGWAVQTDYTVMSGDKVTIARRDGRVSKVRLGARVEHLCDGTRQVFEIDKSKKREEGDSEMRHRCSYCGESGHKRPTCPRRRDDLLFRPTDPTVSRPLPPPTTTVAPLPTAAPAPARKKTLSPWQIAEEVIPQYARVLLYGPPGTGKTTAGNRAGNPERVFNVTLTEEMPAAELRGHYVPRGGEFVWTDGPALQAYRNGGRLVINEIDKGSADALVFCYALLDDPEVSRITLPTGENVSPHPDFTCVATTNGEPDDLPDALQDRFAVRIFIDKPHPDAMNSLPEDLRDAAFKSVSGRDEARVSFRTWKAFADLRDKVGVEIAGRAVFGERYRAITDTLLLAKEHAPKLDAYGAPEDEHYG